MIVKLLTEHHLEFLSLKGGCRGLSESTHVKMPHCWKSHIMIYLILFQLAKKIKGVEVSWGLGAAFELLSSQGLAR